MDEGGIIAKVRLRCDSRKILSTVGGDYNEKTCLR